MAQTIQKQIFSDRQQDYAPEDEITIHIPANEVGVLSGKNSYLRCEFTIIAQDNAGTSGQCKCGLDYKGAGGHSLFNTISVWSGDGNTLIEQLNCIPEYLGTRNYYQETEGLKNMRNLLEGLGTNEGNVADTTISPYYSMSNVGELNALKVELCLPLYMSGVFYGKAFPCLASGGLQLKILLNSAAKSLKADLPNGMVVQRDRSGQSIIRDGAGPAANSTDANSNQNLCWLPAKDVTNFTANRIEGKVSQNLPVMWELFADVPITPAGPNTSIQVKVVGGVAVGTATIPLLLKPNVNVTAGGANFANLIGQHIYYVDDAGLIVDCGILTSITDNSVAFNLTLNFAVGLVLSAATAANNQPVFGQVVDGAAAGEQRMSYKLENVQMICESVEPDQKYVSAMMAQVQSSSGLSLDIKSVNLYRQNNFKNQVVSQLLLPCNERRAKCVLQHQQVPLENLASSYFDPLELNMRQYQYSIKHVNVPNRKVLTNKEYDPASNSWNALCDAERTKTLGAASIRVLRETHPSGRFVFGRGLSKASHSFSCRDNEVRLTQDWGVKQVRFTGSPSATVLPQFDSLMLTFVPHFRKVTMKTDNVVVAY